MGVEIILLIIGCGVLAISIILTAIGSRTKNYLRGIKILKASRVVSLVAILLFVISMTIQIVNYVN